MLVISAEPYYSTACLLYQRFTVIASDMMLYYALYCFIQHTHWQAKHIRLVTAITILTNVGLLLIDHILFYTHIYMRTHFLQSNIS
jgi:alpha-1,3-glucosyltransferase